MRKLILVALVMLGVNLSADVININGRSYDVVIEKINKKKVVFTHQSAEYVVPLSEVQTLFVEESNPNYEKHAAALEKYVKSESPCLAAQMDARSRGKTVVNVLGGFLFGPFALIHKAVKDFHPIKDYTTVALRSESGLMQDPEYILCYRRTAKINAITATSGGWAAWILIVVMTQQ